MIRLPEGVTVRIGGRKYRGEIPAAICPKDLNPPGRDNSEPVKPADVKTPRAR